MPGRPVERRVFLGTLAGGFLAGPLAAAAQQPGKIFRVGHLAASAPSAENAKLLGGTAKALGLTIPPALLLRADELIE